MASILNADNGVVSGTSGLKYSSDNSGVIQLQTSGATTLTLDTSKNAVFANSANVTGALAAGNTNITGTLFTNGAVTFANSTGNTIYLASNGNFGWGNSIPVYPIDISKNDDAAYSGVGIRNANSGASASARAVFFNDNTNAAIALNSTGASNSAGWSRASTLSIHTSSTNANGGISLAARSATGYIDFYTGGSNQRLVIANTGYVGIGTSSPNAPLTVTGISQLGGFLCGAPLNTTNDNSGCVMLFKLGQSQGYQFSGMISVNSWTGQAFVTAHILARYTDDAIEYQVLNAATTSTNISKTTIQLVKATYAGNTYLGIKKNGGGTGTIMLAGMSQGNIPYPFEVASGSYTVTSTIATLN